MHSHTWYAQFGGHLAKLIHGVPTWPPCTRSSRCGRGRPSSSGGGYALSSFCERVALEGADAVIAVSARLAARHPGVPTRPSSPSGSTSSTTGSTPSDTRPIRLPMCSAATASIPSGPTVVFVGRITRQKGVPLLLRAARQFDPAAQLVLCAGAPTRRRSAPRWAPASRRCRRSATGSSGSRRCFPSADVIQLLSHATVFACPSIYEPLGIVNLEAMACEAAVVASATGGIVEVVRDGETGYLVPLEQAPGLDRPGRPGRLRRRLRRARQRALADPERRGRDGPRRPPRARSSTSAGRPSPSRPWGSMRASSDEFPPPARSSRYVPLHCRWAEGLTRWPRCASMAP